MLHTDPSSSSSTNNTPSARPSRLRGLSYLRTHLHSSSSSSNTAVIPSISPGFQPPLSSKTRPHVVRSESFPALTSSPLNSPPLAANAQLHHPVETEPQLQIAGQSLTATEEQRSRRRSSLGDLNQSTTRITTRSRSSTNPNGAMPANASTQPQTGRVIDQSSLPDATNTPPPPQSSLPSIQLIPHQDPRVTRPSLTFGAITRTLPGDSSIIRVGRYSEKDTPTENDPTGPSDAPVGFKSKVVSRRHCEFFYSNAQWYIKDVKSSSGTFLNHIRLSMPSLESKPFPVNDGDIVQLGIDFKGGEEMIFRCVKIRIAVNRGWQKELNTFNKSTIRRLREMAKSGDAGTKNSTECTICLSPIAPIQSLFVAPCSHTWHYKCIRTILNGNSYPQFICPNCRAVSDLNADVDIDFDEWDASEDEEKKEDKTTKPILDTAGEAISNAVDKLSFRDTAVDDTLTLPTASVGSIAASPPMSENYRTISGVSPSPSTRAMNIPMPAGFSTGRRSSGGLSQEEMEASGPMTPLNNVGPFVYD